MKNGSGGHGWGPNSREMIKDELNYSEKQVSDIEDALGTSTEGTFDSIEEKDSDKDYAEVGVTTDGEVLMQYSGSPSKADVAGSAAIGKMLQLDRKGEMSVVPDNNSHNQQLYSGFVGALARSKFEPLHIGPQKRNNLKASKLRYKEAKQRAREHGLKEELDSLVKEHAATIGDSVIEDEEVRTDFRQSINEYSEAMKSVLPLLAAKHMEVFEEGKEFSDFILPDKDAYNTAIHYMKGFEETICGTETED